jgi:hypothetical protein
VLISCGWSAAHCGINLMELRPDDAFIVRDSSWCDNFVSAGHGDLARQSLFARNAVSP